MHNDYLQQLDVSLKNGHAEGEWARSKDQHITDVPHQGPWKLDCLKKYPFSYHFFSFSHSLSPSFSQEIRREKCIQIRDHSNRFLLAVGGL